MIKDDLNIMKLVRAMGYTWDGLKTAFKDERAFRQETVLLILAVGCAWVLPVTLFRKGLLVGAVLIIMVTELLNSSIENIVNYISEDRHPLAKKAKDLGSAAVFVAILFCALLWITSLVEILTF